MLKLQRLLTFSCVKEWPRPRVHVHVTAAEQLSMFRKDASLLVSRTTSATGLITCADLEGGRGRRDGCFRTPLPRRKIQIFLNYTVKFPKICLGVPPPENLNIHRAVCRSLTASNMFDRCAFECPT